MSLFKNKYRTESNRLKNWDYSSEAIYFMTMVTQNRECIFGGIENEVMILNENGKIIENELFKSIEIRDNWIFHNWIIMPNHIHLLIEIKNDNSVPSQISVETHRSASLSLINIPIEETHCGASLQPISKLYRKPNSISSFVAVFKSVTTKQIKSLNVHFKDSIWQSNYHDHIIRNYDSLRTIFYYIKNNPKNWEKDTFNSNNPKL